MKKGLIISGGDYSSLPHEIEYDYVIACDKGAFYADRMGIKPDLIMGDFDSYEGDIHKFYADIPIETFPVMKDDTDTMLAIKKAFELGYKHMIIVCALGGRLDHTISNIQSLAYIAANGGIGEIISDTEHLRTFTGAEGKITLNKKEGFSLSLYSLTDRCSGLSISGAKYNVENVELTNTFPLGHGNSFVDDSVEISLTDGILLIIESKM